MDALEGFETAPKHQEANLNELSGKLQQRVEPKKARVIAWRTWAIAASVILVLTIGGLWLKKTPPATLEKNTVAALKIDKPTVTLKDTVAANTPAINQPPLLAANTKAKSAVIKPGARSVYQQEISSADKSTAAVQPTTAAIVNPTTPSDDDLKETPSVSEIVASTYTENRKEKASNDSLAILAKKAHDKAALLTESKLKGKVDGLTVITSKDAKTQFGYSIINGVIVGKNDGAPVIGAAIRIEGSNKSTVTDVNGYFSMPATASKQTLDIASIGFLPKQISVKSGDSLKVELNPTDNSLSEVVAVGYGVKKANAGAHPQGDMAAFKKYLQANAVLPDNSITGTAIVTFTVNADGSLSDISIKKSLSPAADQKAIDLIKAGPTWVGNTNGKPEQVTVKVKFVKK
nr:TonB family protein [Mucilaginibacter sp. FT3.2]